MPLSRAHWIVMGRVAVELAVANGIGLIVIVVLLALTGWALRQQAEAQRQAGIANTNAEEALDILKDGALNVDVFVTDVIMPNMSGPELIAQLSLAPAEVMIVGDTLHDLHMGRAAGA